MKLNCKVGDLVIAVKSTAGNAGKVFRVVESLGKMQFLGPGGFHEDFGWRVDMIVNSWCGDAVHKWPDSFLRPLRDSDEPDETLAWAGKPQEVKA